MGFDRHDDDDDACNLQFVMLGARCLVLDACMRDACQGGGEESFELQP